jgi:hypothetical protein
MASKGGPNLGNADRGRSAGACEDGGRLMYTLSPMLPTKPDNKGGDPARAAAHLRPDTCGGVVTVEGLML